MNLEDDLDIALDNKFLEMGGDSLGAVQLLNIMEAHCDILLPNFLDILLSGTYGEINYYMGLNCCKLKRKLEGRTNIEVTLPGKRKRVKPSTSEVVSLTLSPLDGENITKAKDDVTLNEVYEKQRVASAAEHGNQEFSQGDNVYPCQVLLCNKCDSYDYDSKTILSIRRCSRTQFYNQGALCTQSSFMKSDLGTKLSSPENYPLRLQQAWTCNLGKCIDASPLIVRDR